MGVFNYFDSMVMGLLLAALLGFAAMALLFIKKGQLALSRARPDSRRRTPARRC